MNESWKPIPGYPDYDISDLGRVRSWKKLGGKRKKPLILKAPPKKNGYLQVTLICRDRGRNNLCVHRIVAETFMPDHDPSKPWVLHINGDKTDNRLGNLYWGDASENALDGVRHGTRGGSKHGRAVLNEDKVMIIREKFDNGAKRTSLANKFGVSASTIGRIVAGQTWRHVLDTDREGQ